MNSINKDKISTVEYFKTLIGKRMNEYSTKLLKEIRSIQEVLGANGISRSGAYVAQTYNAIDIPH